MFNKKQAVILMLFSLVGCMDSKTGNGNQADVTALAINGTSTANTSGVTSLYPTHGGNLRLGLTDAPNPDVKEVWVNIDRIEIKAGPSSFIISENIGMVDLLKLQNGVVMDLGEVIIPIGIKVTQARLVLKEENNHLIHSDGSRCDMQTPSQQNTGLKINSPEFEIREGEAYSMIIDFDAKKSLVFKGNGGCLLKPVLKWGALTSVPASEVDPDGTTSGEEDDLEDGQESPNENTTTTGDTGSTDDSATTGDTGTGDDSATTGNTGSSDDSNTTGDTGSSDDSNTTGDTGTTDDSSTTGGTGTTDDSTTTGGTGSTDNSTTTGGSSSDPIEDEMAKCQDDLGFDLYDFSKWPSDFDSTDYDICF